MAQSRSKTRSNGRTASQKSEKYRFAKNVDGDGTVAEREYRRYAAEGADEMGDPDVLLSVPVVKVDSIHLEVQDLDAQVALKADVMGLVHLNVGVDVHLGKVKLDIKGVEAQALAKIRLDHVAAIVDRVLTTIDRNPELVENLGQALEEVGSGASHLLGETGEAAEQVGQDAGQAVEQVGEGAGQAVGDIGEGAGQAVDQLGEEASAGTQAKKAARTVAKEIGSAASDEARDLSRAAASKAKALGRRRRDKRTREHDGDPIDATGAAVAAADESGVDLSDVEGTGAEGRITVKDVRNAAAG